MRKFFLPLVLACSLLAACSSVTPQQEVAVGALAVDSAAVAANKAFDSGVIKPGSAVDKDVNAALQAGQAAVHKANDSVKAGDAAGISFYVKVLAAAIQDIATTFAKDGIKQ